jgi:hypothetical protein
MSKINPEYARKREVQLDIDPEFGPARSGILNMTAWPASLYDSYILGKFRVVEMISGDAEDFLREHRKNQGEC